MDFLLPSNLVQLQLQHFPLGKVLILVCFLHLSDSFLKTGVQCHGAFSRQQFNIMEISILHSDVFEMDNSMQTATPTD